jgi:hypothetical protein
MSQTAVLVWLSASSLLPTFRAELEGYAHGRLLRLEAPRESAAAPRAVPSAYAADVVAEIEALLEEARSANASLEPARALAALARAERLVREHPELPQAAWSMAEVLQLSADVEGSAPGGADAARALAQRAEALAGPRVAPFSDQAPNAPLPATAPAARALRVRGLGPTDALEWDGVATSATLEASPGEHHARVTRNGRLLYAGWVNVGKDDGELALPVPETVPCSVDDIGQSRIEGGRAIPAPHARCDSYVVARALAGANRGIEAALCERERCGDLATYRRAAVPVRASSNERQKTYWPYAVAAGAGALAITGIVLWRAGAFDRGDGGTRETWTYSGPSPQPLGFRF